jgi:hypothetical protein
VPPLAAVAPRDTCVRRSLQPPRFESGTLHGLSALALACNNDNITVVTCAAAARFKTRLASQANLFCSYDLVDHFTTDDAHEADLGCCSPCQRRYEGNLLLFLTPLVQR